MHLPKPHQAQTEFSDSALIENFRKSDDRSSLAVLFQRYSHLVLSICLKYLRNREDSQDAVMSIFSKLDEDLKRHEITNFKAWLYATTKNYCRMHMRRRLRENLAMDKSEAADPVIVDNLELELINRLDGEVMRLELKSALEQLDEAQRQCIRLFYFEEKSYREIADLTQLDIKKVKSHLQNGKRNLQIMLSKKKRMRNAGPA